MTTDTIMTGRRCEACLNLSQGRGRLVIARRSTCVRIPEPTLGWEAGGRYIKKQADTSTLWCQEKHLNHSFRVPTTDRRTSILHPRTLGLLTETNDLRQDQARCSHNP